jgi:hypothetical protein
MDLLCAFELCTATAAALVLVSRSISHISAEFLHHTQWPSHWQRILLQIGLTRRGLNGLACCFYGWYQLLHTGDWSMAKRILSICHVL